LGSKWRLEVNWVRLAILFVVVGGVANAADPPNAPAAKPAVVSGYLIDIHCAEANHKHKKFAKNHARACLENEACARTGYAVLTDSQKLIRFDEKGNKEARTLLAITERKDKDWRVSVQGTLTGDTIQVRSLLLR
jgi:hypothetical protein